MSGNTEYISVNEMIVNWNKILSRIGKISGCSAEFLPNPMLIGKASMEKVRAARELSEIMYKNQVLDSMEERRILYYRIGYCSASDSRFTDFRNLVYRLKTACGYHGEFRGVLVLDITEWEKHSKENYFDVLLCYLADIREDVYTVFCMDTDPTCEDRETCRKISQYFRLNMVDLTKADTAEYFQFVLEKFRKSRVGIEQEAEHVLSRYIEKMRENKSFCGYETVRRMAEEMVCQFYFYTSENRKMTADFIYRFFKITEIDKDKGKDREQTKIGFHYIGEGKNGQSASRQVSGIY